MIPYLPPLKFKKGNPPSTYKTINVGFILANMKEMNVKQMAQELDVSPSKIRATIKEFNIDYPKKNPMNHADIICSKCGKPQPKKAYYKHPKGILQPCIECKKEQEKDRKKNQKTNLDFIFEQSKYRP